MILFSNLECYYMFNKSLQYFIRIFNNLDQYYILYKCLQNFRILFSSLDQDNKFYKPLQNLIIYFSILNWCSICHKHLQSFMKLFSSRSALVLHSLTNLDRIPSYYIWNICNLYWCYIFYKCSFHNSVKQLRFVLYRI